MDYPEARFREHRGSFHFDWEGNISERRRDRGSDERVSVCSAKGQGIAGGDESRGARDREKAKTSMCANGRENSQHSARAYTMLRRETEKYTGKQGKTVKGKQRDERRQG